MSQRLSFGNNIYEAMRRRETFVVDGPDSSHAIGTFETAVAASSFELAATDDWTSAAIASIEVDTERRERFFRKSIPHFLWSIALDFASTTRSSTYYALRGERAVYRSFSLRKPHGSKMPTT